MKLAAAWLTAPETRDAIAALTGQGANVWFVGGCVRNTLLGVAVSDLDLCTDALPEAVLACAARADIKAVPTGIEHGTVTLVVGDTQFEVTTLRRDIDTDGRRATVAFTTALAEDAARRDFTMNALYATPKGEILDPTGQGITDIAARRVRFIGTPAHRITEDYLRILRFFRFHAWYGDPAGGIDAEGLAACAAHADGLGVVSRERLGAEMIKLLYAPDPAPAVASMAASGVLAQVLAGADPNVLTRLIALEETNVPPFAPAPLRRFATLADAQAATELRFSRADRKVIASLRDGMQAATPPGALGYRHGAEIASDIVLLRAALFEQPALAADLQEVQRGAQAVFPIRAVDLQPEFEGPALGAELARLETDWIASGFEATKGDLLS